VAQADHQLGNRIVTPSSVGMLQVIRRHLLSVSSRWVPVLTLLSGTQRASRDSSGPKGQVSTTFSIDDMHRVGLS
jgi:hypothetical protein